MKVNYLKRRHIHFMAVPGISLFMALSCFAQRPDLGDPSPGGPGEPPVFQSISPDEIAEKESKWMKKKLKLNKEQLQKVKVINSVYAFKRKDFISATDSRNRDNNKKIMDKLAVLDKEKDDELRKVLSQKQYDTYLKKKDELNRQVRPAESQGGNLPPPPPPDSGF